MEKEQFLDYLIEKQKQMDMDEEVKEFCKTAETIFRLVTMTESEETWKVSYKNKLNQAKEPWEQSLQIARMMKDEHALQIGEEKLEIYRGICGKLELM